VREEGEWSRDRGQRDLGVVSSLLCFVIPLVGLGDGLGRGLHALALTGLALGGGLRGTLLDATRGGAQTHTRLGGSCFLCVAHALSHC
jgi:hypothetical protein